MLREYRIRLHVIRKFDILLRYIDIILCEMNCQFANMIVHTCSMRQCIMRYESSILRDAFVSVVFGFMNEPAPLLLRHLVDTCLYQSAQSASSRWVIKILQTFYV